jgi:hypothetical protein
MSDVKERRAARKAELRARQEKQEEVELEALDAAEIEHGDNRVAHVVVPYVDGLPTTVIVRAPDKDDVSRYRTRCSKAQRIGRGGEPVSDVEEIRKATEQVARRALVYPDAETFATMCETWQGLAGSVGAAAIKLHGAVERDEGNE